MFDIKENLKKLPDSPGVYMHKDRLGQVIYVGKAVSLKNRVRQYFQSSANQTPKVQAMVSHIAEFEYITCQTEMEALILECNLIKKYAPKYNVLLRDDKTYPYIKVTIQEEYPRVLKTRLLKKDGSRYFGPYSDTGAVNMIIELLNKVFVLKRCSAASFPDDYRPCLNYHIKECRGICTGEVSPQEYRTYVNKVLDFLNGKQKPLLDYLTEKMQMAAAEMNYEEAAIYRDYIASAKTLGETQRVTVIGGHDMDMILPAGSGENTVIVLFTVRGSKLSGRETFAMRAEGEDDYESLVSQFIKQYYSRWAVVPGEIIVPQSLKERELLEQFLEDQGDGRKVKITVPQKGDKRALLELARRDVVELSKTIDLKVASASEKEQALREALAQILDRLNPDGGPQEVKDAYRVESYDISNTNGVDTVGAMVVFSNLKPVKKDYRRFKIRTVEGQDDYGSLAEMLERRFKRALEGDSGFSVLPDLILMDGGRGQASTAEKVLNGLGICVPVLGMAKDDSHRTRALVNGSGEEILLKDNPLMFKYCGTIQEEVHRFAIEYHRNLHNRNTIGSVLDNIEGIGPAKRNALLSHFNSVEDIKKADVESLMKVKGITEKNAHAIKEYFS